MQNLKQGEDPVAWTEDDIDIDVALAVKSESADPWESPDDPFIAYTRPSLQQALETKGNEVYATQQPASVQPEKFNPLVKSIEGNQLDENFVETQLAREGFHFEPEKPQCLPTVDLVEQSKSTETMMWHVEQPDAIRQPPENVDELFVSDEPLLMEQQEASPPPFVKDTPSELIEKLWHVEQQGGSTIIPTNEPCVIERPEPERQAAWAAAPKSVAFVEDFEQSKASSPSSPITPSGHTDMEVSSSPSLASGPSYSRPSPGSSSLTNILISSPSPENTTPTSAYDCFREALVEVPSVSGVLSTMQEWVSHAPTAKEQLASELHCNLLNWAATIAPLLQERLNRSPPFAAALERRKESVAKRGVHEDSLNWLLLECLERMVVWRLRDRCNEIFANEIKEDLKLQRKLEWCRLWAQPKFLDVTDAVEHAFTTVQSPHLFRSHGPIDESTVELKHLDTSLADVFQDQLNLLSAASSPRAKLTAIVNLGAVITAVAGDANARSTELSADDLLPVFVWGLMRSSVPPVLVTASEFISTLRHPQLREGSDMYSLTMAQAATEFLLQMRVFRDLRIESLVVRRLVHHTCPTDEMYNWLGNHLELSTPVVDDSSQQQQQQENSQESTGTMLQKHAFTVGIYKVFVDLLNDEREELFSIANRLKSFVELAQQDSADGRILLRPDRFHSFISSTVRLLVPKAWLGEQLLPSLGSLKLSSFDRRLALVLLLTECLERFLCQRLATALQREAKRVNAATGAKRLFRRVATALAPPKTPEVSPLESAAANIARLCGTPDLPFPKSRDIQLLSRKVVSLSTVETPRDILRICDAAAAVANVIITDGDISRKRRHVLVFIARLLIIKPAPIDTAVHIGKSWRSPLLITAIDKLAIRLFELAIEIVIKVGKDETMTTVTLNEKLFAAAGQILNRQ